MLTDNAIDIFVLGDVDEKRMIERFSDFNFTDRAVSKEISYQQSLTESSVVTDEKRWLNLFCNSLIKCQLLMETKTTLLCK